MWDLPVYVSNQNVYDFYQQFNENFIKKKIKNFEMISFNGANLPTFQLELIIY